MRALPLSLSFVLLAACGGSVVTIDGSVPADAASDAPTDGAAVDSGRDAGGRDAATCEALSMRLEPLRQAAVRCSITSPQKQCSQFLKDLCCPLSVTDSSSPAAKAFEAALDDYVKACPPPPCPPVACPKDPSGVCGMQLTCMQF